jgi:hypothetical protein
MAGRAWILALPLVLGPAPASGHDVFPPGQLEATFAEIARLQARGHEVGDADALYALGERIEQIVEILNQDAAAHGAADPFTLLVVNRLRSWDVRVEFSQPEGRYAYDLAAFRAYLTLAPDGSRAGAAWYRLLARSFYERMGPDPDHPSPAPAAETARAIEEEERFLRRHPADPRRKEVTFFLAVDLCRRARAEHPARRGDLRRCRSALYEIRARYPDSMEARAAETLLEQLEGGRG